MTAPDDWRDLLAQGGVICRALQDGALVEETTPVAVADLWAPIRIHETGSVSRGDFGSAYRDFVESGAEAGRWAGEACETIVKLGAAIQFRQAFTVEFRRKVAATRGRLRKSRLLAALALATSAALAEPPARGACGRSNPTSPAGSNDAPSWRCIRLRAGSAWTWR